MSLEFSSLEACILVMKSLILVYAYAALIYVYVNTIISDTFYFICTYLLTYLVRVAASNVRSRPT